MAVRKKDLIEALEARIPFRVAQRILKTSGFPVSRTWDETKNKIADMTSKKMDTHALYDTYVATLASYDKSIALYKVGARKRAAILSQGLALAPDPKSTLVKRYPYVADDKILGKFDHAATELVAIEPLGAVTAFIFSTVQVRTQQVPIPLSRLSKSISSQFYEVFGRERVYNHGYDAVIVPHSGEYVWLSCDFPAYAKSDFADFARISVPKRFNELLQATALAKPENLFSAIGAMYADDAQGIVLSLSHVPPTGSVKHERMRNGTCLRKELFHEAGVKAVLGRIEPFAIGVAWPTEGDGDENGESEFERSTELHIGGEARQIGKADPFVDAALVRSAFNIDELTLVIDKLTSYL